MDPLVLALARAGPSHVSEYLLLFRAALSHHFDVNYPGRTENIYLLSDLYVGPTNKRHIVFYIGVGNTRDTVTRVTRVDYTMPLSPTAAKVFGIDTDVPVAPEGPEFMDISMEGRPAPAAVASDVATLVAAADPRNRIATWQSEITRLRGVHAAAAEGSELKKKAAQLLRFWIEMYEKIDIEIAREYILSPGTRTPRARALRLRARTRRAAAPAAPNVPLGPVVASSGSRPPRRYVSAHRPHTSDSHSSTSPRRTRRLPRNPVTGKINRARQPYSDPRSSSTDRPPPPAPPAAGPRARRHPRVLNRNILYNARGIAFHPSESDSEGSESEEIEFQNYGRSNSSENTSEFENIF